VAETNEAGGVQWSGLLLIGMAGGAAWGCHRWQAAGGESLFWAELSFSLAVAACLSVVLWQACEPFADAAQWFGKYWRIPSSVRGATLDAVASSMPELFTGLFFVLVAVWGDHSLNERLRLSTEGYGSTIATCAGSAIYNLILIPALCCLTLVMSRRGKTSLTIESEVLRRDGNWVMFTQFGLLLILFSPRLYWWMGALGLAAYCFYVIHLAWATRGHRRRWRADQVAATAEGQSAGSPADQQRELDLLNKRVPVLFGLANIKMNPVTSIGVLLGCTIVAATACYFLVEVTNDLARVLNTPAFFVSVILVASVSSIPDTLLSIGATRRGDDSGAMSNVFGSNVFDICVCMSIPLLVVSYLNAWQPIHLVGDNAETMRGVTGLRVLLFVMTSIAMFLFWTRRKVTAGMAIFFCGLYLIFVAYAIVGGLGWISL